MNWIWVIEEKNHGPKGKKEWFVINFFHPGDEKEAVEAINYHTAVMSNPDDVRLVQYVRKT